MYLGVKRVQICPFKGTAKGQAVVPKKVQF